MSWEVRSEMTYSKDPLRELLLERGHDPDAFLDTSLKRLHDPFLMKDMYAAVDMTVEAIASHKKIRIAGDYDADGITSVFTMMTLLDLAGADLSYEIPDRRDGYGLSNKMIDNAHRDGCELIITCDNGIACVDQVTYARSLGIDVIITDHHEPQAVLPDTLIINPKQHDCTYPFKELAGCAVAWKFCQAVLSHYGMLDKSFQIMEIIATGTVADVMDLVDENRIIVTHGLKAYPETSISGLAQLMGQMDLFRYPITSTTIGYSIGPAFNATGRLLTADIAVQLLLEKSPIKSLRLAKYVTDLNEERKRWTRDHVDGILKRVQDLDDDVLVLTDAHIPSGILGILASRLIEIVQRPVLLMSLDDTGNFYKGSGRSVEGYDLFENLMQHKHLFDAVGGHDVACGFTIPVENVDTLRELLNASPISLPSQEARLRKIDYSIEPYLVNLKLAEQMALLEPCGKGNERPSFEFLDCHVLSHKAIGKEGKTLKLAVDSAGTRFECIAFNMVDKFNDIYQEGAAIDIAFYLSINEWNNRRTLQLELIDMRPSS